MNNSLIDSDGYLNFSLYHGTSIIFLDSIKRNGLGSKNKSINYDLSLFKKLCAAHQSLNSDWWNNNSYIWMSMIESKKNSRCNFSYGGTYLSPSIFTAYSYANNTKYGSELLSSIIESYQELNMLDQKLASTLMKDHSDIIQVISLEHKPVVLNISKIHISTLLTEHDQDVSTQIDQMFRISKIVDPEISWQQYNFLTFETISFDQISVTNL